MLQTQQEAQIDRDALPSSLRAAIHDAQAAGCEVPDWMIERLLDIGEGVSIADAGRELVAMLNDQ